MFWFKSQKGTVVDETDLYLTSLIKRYESFSAKPYTCPGGVATIGYGTTVYPDGTKVTLKDKPITEKQAEEYLKDYVRKQILPHIDGFGLTPNQTIALTSLIYNIGWTAFSRSACWKAIKAKNWGEAYNEWNWIKSKGKVLNGLIKRRSEEMYLFFGDL